MMKSLQTYAVALAVLAVAGAATLALAGPPTSQQTAPKAPDTMATVRQPHIYFIEGDTLVDLEAVDTIRRSYKDAETLFEEAERRARRLEDLLIVEPPSVGEVILPDTVYTTEVTIGPEGIEYYDSAGRRQMILGRPVLPDAPFVLGEEGRGALTLRYPSRRSSDIVQMGADIHIARDERVEGNVTSIGGNIQVEGEVEGDVIAVLGNVTIDGYVHGSAVAPLGRVQIGPTGRVRKDVAASVIDDQPGSLIGGHKSFTGVRLPAGLNVFRRLTVVYALSHLGLVVFTLFLILLGHVFAAKNITTIRARISTNGVKSFIIGLLMEFLGIPILFVLLLITVIGIPVAVLALPIAVVVATVLGLSAFGLMLGEKLANNTGFYLPTQLGKTIAGFGALMLLVVFGALLVLTFHSPISVIGWITFAIGHAIVFIAITTGLGAVVLTRFGTRSATVPAGVTGTAPELSGSAPPAG